MSEVNRMSRRDWFRLRPRREEPQASPATDATEQPTAGIRQHSIGESTNGLQPVAHPENHDGMNLSELPPMREALLNEEQVRQLFSDIEGYGSDIVLMQRSAPSRRATLSNTLTAEQFQIARDSLLSGTVGRLQIRYHWQSANWIDTLERREDGVRLVRITHAPPASSSNLLTSR